MYKCGLNASRSDSGVMSSSVSESGLSASERSERPPEGVEPSLQPLSSLIGTVPPNTPQATEVPQEERLQRPLRSEADEAARKEREAR